MEDAHLPGAWAVMLAGKRTEEPRGRLDIARPDQPAPDVINDRGIRIEEGLFGDPSR